MRAFSNFIGLIALINGACFLATMFTVDVSIKLFALSMGTFCFFTVLFLHLSKLADNKNY
jgi:hypothetical protein